MDTELGPIGQIHLSFNDVDRAVAFYRDVLGLRLLFTMPAQSLAFFDCAGTGLYLGDHEPAETTNGPLLYFRVESARDARARIAASGAEFVDEPHVVHRQGDTELWMTFFRDPDGTMLALMSEEPAG